MPPAELVLQPSLILAMWAGGMALGAGIIAWWGIVGRGFFWVMVGSIVLIGGWLVPGSPGLGGLALLLVVASVAVTARPRVAAGLLVIGGGMLVAIAAGIGGWLIAISGAVALGGVTDEMLLGHWYLVDPSLPRWALKRLDVAAILALVIDAVVLVAAGALLDIGVVGWAWVGLVVLSVLLMVGVWFSIGEPGYSGVMAATGLSYLAVLTALGGTVAGRALIGQVATQLGSLGA